MSVVVNTIELTDIWFLRLVVRCYLRVALEVFDTCLVSETIQMELIWGIKNVISHTLPDFTNYSISAAGTQSN